MPMSPTFGPIIQGSADSELLTGTVENDQIIAFDGDDTLDGAAGSDVLLGGSGNDLFFTDALDLIDGGVGIDTVDFSALLEGIVIDLDVNSPPGSAASQLGAILTAPPAAGGTQSAAIIDVENVIGSQGNDFILGNQEVNILEGGLGNDTIHSFGGADIIDGGAGIDTILFSAGPAVEVDLDNAGNAVSSFGDTLRGIENIVGSNAGDDTLTGNGLDNVINGNGGADILSGQGGDDTFITDGLDQIDGGLGVDTVDFSNLVENATGGAFNGVVVDLDVDSAGGNGTPGQNGAILDLPPAAGGVPLNGLNLVNIENVIGTDFNDGIFGNNEINVLEGGLGDDVFHSFGGADTVDGGEGTDTVLFSAGPGVVVDLDDAGNALASVGDTLISIENITGSGAQADDISGNAGVNVLNGNGGDDTLTGEGGDDILNGAAGNDTADFSDIDVPVEVTLTDATAVRETGFSISFADVAVNVLNPAAPAATDFVGELLAGRIYFNVHTNDFGGGEIRGQLDSIVSDETVGGVRTITITSDLDAGQEPNGTSDSEATGSATVVFEIAADGSITYATDLSISGLTTYDLLPVAGISSIHLHNAERGVNGPVVLDVVQDAGGDVNGDAVDPLADTGDGDVFVEVTEPVNGTAVREAGFSVTFADVAVNVLNPAAPAATDFVGELLAGRIYFNVHTNDFGGGEIRGQLDSIVSDETVGGVRTITITADLDAAQEPNGASDSDATGSAVVVFVVAADGSITYTTDLSISGLATSDLLPVAGISSIHLHNAERGVNGPVVLDIIQDAGGDVNGDVVDPLADTGDGNVFVEAVETDQLISIENIIGSNDADIITATGDVANIIDAGAGEDTVSTGEGDDLIISDGVDSINGGSGTDTVDFSDRTEGIVVDLDVNSAGGSGTSGQDGGVLDVPPAAGGVVQFELDDIENVIGTDFDDGIFGNNEINVLEGGLGNDVFHSFGGADTIDGGEGTDTVLFSAGPGVIVDLDNNGDAIASVGDALFSIENITGSGAQADDISGNNQANVLSGNGGDDTLSGEAGFDTLNGGAGNDTLNGGSQADLLSGGADDDALFGGQGFDRLLGDSGNDELFGELNSDVLFGGTGNDSLSGGQGFDRLVGESGDDELSGGLDNDVLLGGTGNDLLLGNEGNDRIIAGAGRDTLDGGEGNDFLVGAFNADIFVFEDNFGQDIILDFAQGSTTEVIDLSAVTEITDFADLSANHLSQVGANAVITDGANTITLFGVNAVDIIEGDFIF